MEVGIRNDLVFGTVSANDFGIYISGEGVYNAPERVVELLDVPGRNGALTIDKGHYGNITIEYPAFTFADSQAEFRRKVNAYKNAIMAQVGYQKLTDTYHPDEYRLGMFVEGLEVSPVGYGRSGSFTLKFNCKPQRYLADGQQAITVADEDIVVNPTLYESSPLLMVEGYGTIGFNGYIIEIEDGTVGRIGPLWETKKWSVVIADENDTPTDASEYIGRPDLTALEPTDTFDFDVSITVEAYEANFGSCTLTGGGTYSYYYTGDDESSNLYVTVTRTCTFPKTTTSFPTELTSVAIVTSQGEHLEFDFGAYYTPTGDVYVQVTMTRYDNPWRKTADVTVTPAYSTSTMTTLGNPTYIDCEIGEAYKYVDGEMVSLNAYIDLGSDLPKLSPGNNTFDLSLHITDLQLVPRWWEL